MNSLTTGEPLNLVIQLNYGCRKRCTSPVREVLPCCLYSNYSPQQNCWGKWNCLSFQMRGQSTRRTNDPQTVLPGTAGMKLPTFLQVNDPVQGLSRGIFLRDTCWDHPTNRPPAAGSRVKPLLSWASWGDDVEVKGCVSHYQSLESSSLLSAF